MRLAVTAGMPADGFCTGSPVTGSLEAHRGAYSHGWCLDEASLLMAGQFPSVLVGFDGSADSAEALRVGTAIAGLHVVALSVLRPAVHFEPTDDETTPDVAMRALAEAHFSRLRRNQLSRDLRMSTEVVFAHGDSVAKVLDEYATLHGFQLLVLGRHGDGAVRRSRLGRVASRAAEASSVPVLLLSAP